MYKYTLCLIRNEDKFLLLNRNKKPAMGMWNGVGGKIEDSETPVEGVIRETFEETGIQLEEVIYAGNIVLQSKDTSTGIYLFLAELPRGIKLYTPLDTAEGILEWKSLDWMLDEDNMGVISNLKNYLPAILKGYHDLEHTFSYNQHEILDYSTSKISSNVLNQPFMTTL